VSGAVIGPPLQRIDDTRARSLRDRSAVRDHKSILAWQEAHKVTDAVFDGARTSWKPFAAAVFAQLQRASLSVQLNIAEGYALRSSRRFRNHLEKTAGARHPQANLARGLVTRRSRELPALPALVAGPDQAVPR